MNKDGPPIAREEAEIRARRATRTSGEWYVDQAERDEIVVRVDPGDDSDDDHHVVCVVDPSDVIDRDAAQADADFIAHAPAAIEHLLSVVESQRSALVLAGEAIIAKDAELVALAKIRVAVCPHVGDTDTVRGVHDLIRENVTLREVLATARRAMRETDRNESIDFEYTLRQSYQTPPNVAPENSNV